MPSGIGSIKKLMILLLTVTTLGVVTYELIKYSPQGAMNEFHNYQINHREIDNKLKSRLNKTNLSKSDELFLKGNELLDKDVNKAKKYLILAIDNMDNSTTDTTKVYINKILSEIELKEGNINKAIQHVKDAFISISPTKYNKYYNLVWDMLSPLLSYKEGRTLAIDLLNQMENTLLSKEVDLFLHNKLSSVYLTLSDYDKAMENKFDVHKLSFELKDYYTHYKNILEISTIARMEHNYDLAIESIYNVDESKIEDELDRMDIKVYKYMSLAKTYAIIGEANKSLDSLKQVSNYESILPKYKIDDIEILKNIIKCEAYITKGEYDKAKTSLEKANELLKNDTKEAYIDKDIQYFLISGKLNEKQKLYEEAEIDYKKAVELSQLKSNTELLKDAMEGLENIYIQTDNIEKLKEYNKELSSLKERKNKKIYKVYYEHLFYEKSHLDTEKQNKNIKELVVLISIALIFILSILFKISICPLMKKKMINRKVVKNMESDNYKLFYQPVINPKNDKIIGFEGLLRLKIKDEIIMPNILINEIEYCNMMGEISKYILRKVISDYNRIKEKLDFKETFYLSINVSLREIEDEDIIKYFIKTINRSNLNRNSICIEITENIGGQDINRINNNINLLKEAGFMIAIDDFGVDYSNLYMLDKIQYDIIKLDKFFITEAEEGNFNNFIIEVSDYLSMTRNKVVIVEGVETKEQRDFIVKMKSDKYYIQGYYYSKPVEI